MSQPLSIYLHIPFCQTKCTYCAFNTYIKLEHLIDEFVDALAREITIVGSHERQTVHTVFFGGGTPSLLTPEHIASLMTVIAENFDLTTDSEITLESNPNDINRSYLSALRGIGINRLSIGVQSAHNHELKLFARRHDTDQIASAVSAARQAGFDNINLDLIYGIPHQTLEGWDWTLKQTLSLDPDHISLYALGLEEGTPMYDWVAQGRLPQPDDDLAADMYELATDVLASAGLEQYEISNWSKPGRACRHNLQYWRNLSYIGLGPGAHGYAAGMRYWTVLAPQKYIHVLRNNQMPPQYPRTPATDETVPVDYQAEISDTLIMGLRLTQEGIRWDTFQKRFDIDLREIHQKTIQKFVDYGLLETDAERRVGKECRAGS